MYKAEYILEVCYASIPVPQVLLRQSIKACTRGALGFQPQQYTIGRVSHIAGYLKSRALISSFCQVF